MATGAGTRRIRSPNMTGMETTARKSARENGTRTGAAARRPATTTTRLARMRRNLAPGLSSMRSNMVLPDVPLEEFRDVARAEARRIPHSNIRSDHVRRF